MKDFKFSNVSLGSDICSFLRKKAPVSQDYKHCGGIITAYKNCIKEIFAALSWPNDENFQTNEPLGGDPPCGGTGRNDK